MCSKQSGQHHILRDRLTNPRSSSYTPAVNVAFAAACSAATPRAAVAPGVQQSIDISYPPGTQQQTRRTLLQRANRTDTDGHRSDVSSARRLIQSAASRIQRDSRS